MAHFLKKLETCTYCIWHYHLHLTSTTTCQLLMDKIPLRIRGTIKKDRKSNLKMCSGSRLIIIIITILYLELGSQDQTEIKLKEKWRKVWRSLNQRLP